MDGQEIEDEGGAGDSGLDKLLIDGVSIAQAQFLDGGGPGLGGKRTEAQQQRAGAEFHDLIIDGLPLPGVAAAFLNGLVQAPEEFGRDGEFGGVGMDQVEARR